MLRITKMADGELRDGGPVIPAQVDGGPVIPAQVDGGPGGPGDPAGVPTQPAPVEQTREESGHGNGNSDGQAET